MMMLKNCVAVVGIDGLFPGAFSLDLFWENLVNKKNTLAEVPESRWIIPAFDVYSPFPVPDKAYSTRACLVQDDFGFNPKGFDIEESLIRELDTLYHMVLHTGRRAWQSCITGCLDKNRVGVCLAAIALPSDSSSAFTREILGRAFEQRVFKAGKAVDPGLLTRGRALGACVTSVPGYVLAKALGLGGGSFTLDAACASSIYAVKLACDQLLSGQRDAMIAGGVSRPECLYTQVGFSQLQALSPSGICAPFDESADGLVVGEGAGILVLKRLEDALKHGDTVYGIIRGIGLSNDMRGNLLAPDTKGQVRAMEAAYKSAGLTPFDMDHIECHGAGTPVGDKTELASLRTLWGQTGWTLEQCAIGSVKSMTGHLLTGAGAAGMIKTLLAIKHKTLPPSLNFTKPHADSPLINSPFRVQTHAQEWNQRKKHTPRRAAVSAFGFGGINAHLVFEEYSPAAREQFSLKTAPDNSFETAIIGMGAAFGRLKTLDEFQEAVFNSGTAIDPRPPARWKHADYIAHSLIGHQGAWGAYMDKITVSPGEFQIPPNEIPDILPQQLLMLKVAAQAMEDAGLPLRQYRPRMGAAIGMEFDPEASDYHIRWNLFNLAASHGETYTDQQLEQLRNQYGPPLTRSRVLGSLGGITAGRIAREFRLGGPCFTVSDESLSGIRALEIAAQSLHSRETDIFIAGAVELAGDIRNILINSALQPWTEKQTIHPFDKNADGSIPGEGAAALILKRLDQAIADKDRIYAVIKGIGTAGSGSRSTREAYTESAKQAAKQAKTSFTQISHMETHGSASPLEDSTETHALHELFRQNTNRPSTGSVKPVIGSTGASAGLASVVKTALSLYHEIIPPLKGFTGPLDPVWNKGLFHIPVFPGAWHCGPAPKKACVCSITKYGNCSHVILESWETPVPQIIPPAVLSPCTETARSITQNIKASAQAHNMFLEFTNQLMQNYGKAFKYLNSLTAQMLTHQQPPSPAYTKEMCMEFAAGSAAKVLGPEFTQLDTYKVRVRLPDEPLMLVDRIISIHGKKASLGPGRIITEHDVLPGAWYLDGNKAPVCITVEAGQADLFLSSYLGIDLAVKGKRAYRLLDAEVTFHRHLPVPGETIQYDIHIDRFVRQGETYLFFFRFQGTINNQPLITMKHGCAGFFTEQEVKNSGGIIITQDEKQKTQGKKDFTQLVPMKTESYNDKALDKLRQGDPAPCFGPLFNSITIPKHQRLPAGRMNLIHRITKLDPDGGRFGLGIIQAQADIHPHDWFLTCHFPDDMVMPGTLMYECCAHTLRVYLQRMGWISENPEAAFEPVTDVEAVLKCRGPVTPQTRQVLYEVEIKQTGYSPEPYALADAVMYADGHRIVSFKNMSLKLTGASRKEIETYWAQKNTPALYTTEQLLAFCQGNPSEAFGQPYKIFDKQRKIARLPRPPYFFMHRITKADHPPWELKPGGWIQAEYDITGDEWYFKTDRSGIMPFCILLEIALQPCGWLAAYAGSALKSETDLKFRNLGGSAVLHKNIKPGKTTLTMLSRITKVSEAGGMIIQNYDMHILQSGQTIYQGDTYFGFFTAQALASQVGIQPPAQTPWKPAPRETGTAFKFPETAPLTPQDKNQTPCHLLSMPSKALLMIDRIETYIPHGGPAGLGYIKGTKTVNPNEWFFRAHFYQDPVCPGSLGIESFIQLIKYAALQTWPHLTHTHTFQIETGTKHNWTYRGQIIQQNKQIEVEAHITQIKQNPDCTIRANGSLKVDGLHIYQIENLGLKLIPA